MSMFTASPYFGKTGYSGQVGIIELAEDLDIETVTEIFIRVNSGGAELWLNGTLLIERGIVRQRVGNVKTAESEQKVSVDTETLAVMNSWRQTTQFVCESDWMFASPAQIGRLPVSYPWVWRSFQQAALRAGIPRFGTHSLRHSYRSWLDAAGTPIAVQQKLMRHSDIRTTLNVYGDVVTDEMAQANSKVARMALSRAN